MKHIDFLLIDMVCLQLSFFLSFFFRQTGMKIFEQNLYRDMILLLLLVPFVVSVFADTFKNVLKRGYYKEFVITAQNVIIVLLITAAYLFVTKQGEGYSRLVWLYTGGLYFVSSFSTRLLWKTFLKSRKKTAERTRSLLIITSKDLVREVLVRIDENNYERFHIAGIVLIDEDMAGKYIDKIPVVANKDTASEYARKEWIDEVFVNIPKEIPLCTDLIEQFISMGVTVHLNLSEMGRFKGQKEFVEHISSYTVLTYALNTASLKQAFAKRLIDICGALVGCVLTVILAIIVGPIIYIQSPGPIFFVQERVGRNGRKFKLYKFRSMYMDAEERKAALMEQNRVAGNLMFKMENDPRVIGSEKGPGKGIGNFIRKTSIDEFPQFWNVLKGDMSLVGTRPPTVGEWQQYSLNHRARLAIKPGMTGLWQVSGRSDITDFNEVVKLDLEYIQNWSMGLDLKLLVQTVLVVIGGKGSM